MTNDCSMAVPLVEAPPDGEADAERRLGARIPDYIRFTFLAALLIGFLVHGYALANKTVNYDSYMNIMNSTGNWAKHGRWLLGPVMALSGHVSTFWFSGVLSLLYLAVAVCMVVSILGVRSRVGCASIAAVMVALPAVACYINFPAFAESYFVSLALAVFGCYLAFWYRWGFLPGAVPIALSLGIYQAFFPTAAALLIMALILGILRREAVRKTLVRGLKFLVTLSFGLVLYMVITKIALHVSDTKLDGYQAYDKMGSLDFARLPTHILRSFGSIVDFYWRDNYFQPGFYRYVFALIAAASVFLVLCVAKRRGLLRQGKTMALLGGLIVLFPFAVGMMHVLQMNDAPHSMTFYALVLPLVLAVSLIDLPRARRRFLNWVPWVIVLGVGAYTYNYARLSSLANFQSNITYEYLHAYYTRLLTRIEATDGYSERTRLMAIGAPHMPLTGTQKRITPDSSAMRGFYTPASVSRLHFQIQSFMLTYLAFPPKIGWVKPEDLPEDARASYAAMPLYPADGSIRRFGDVIVIKFQNLKPSAPIAPTPGAAKAD